MLTSFLAFLGIAAIVIVTPGPDTAVTVRNTLLGGRSAGIVTGCGIAVGQAIWALFASAGLVALLVASEPLFLAVKYAGAAYLVWLGLQALLGAWRGVAPEDLQQPGGNRRLGPPAAFLHGLVSDLGNPKMAVFFASVLPQFGQPLAPAFGGSLFAALMLLGIVFSLMTLLWLTIYAVAVARAGDYLRRPSIRRIIEAVTGACLMALGLRIASESR